MRRHTAVLSVGMCSVLLVSGCKSTKHAATAPPKVVLPNTASSSAAASSTPSAPASLSASASVASASAAPAAPVSSAPAAALSSGPPTPVDPCQLVTAAEASALAGATFGAGAESAQNGSRRCVYGGQTTNVFAVVVAQAPDSKTANAEWAQEEAQAEAAMVKDVPAGVTPPQVADVSGYGDRAATASAALTVQGHTIGISAIYVLKGATFFSYSDLVLDKSAPTVAALEAQATVSLGRVP
jgi:hypothetical protein